MSQLSSSSAPQIEIGGNVCLVNSIPLIAVVVVENVSCKCFI